MGEKLVIKGKKCKMDDILKGMEDRIRFLENIIYGRNDTNTILRTQRECIDQQQKEVKVGQVGQAGQVDTKCTIKEAMDGAG